MDTPRLVVRRQLLAAGWSDNDLRRQRRIGELVKVGRGVYVEAPGAPPRFEARHALLAAVRDERQAADGVLSHVSAAVLHGLSTWGCGSTASTAPAIGGPGDGSALVCTCMPLRSRPTRSTRSTACSSPPRPAR